MREATMREATLRSRVGSQNEGSDNEVAGGKQGEVKGVWLTLERTCALWSLERAGL